MKYLFVIDMQNDFVTGSLGSKEAQHIVPNVVKKVENAFANKEEVIFTRDTHGISYLDTLEGKLLPVEHCYLGTNGWNIIPELQVYVDEKDEYGYTNVHDKYTFGYQCIEQTINYRFGSSEDDEIEVIGLCTDICVVSNALYLRMLFPNTKITVDASCCAGTTPKKHLEALSVMESCQITVINKTPENLAYYYEDNYSVIDD